MKRGKTIYKDGDTVRYAGIIDSIKKKYTKNNKIMAFVNIEDLYGNIEVLVFENAYRSAGNSLIEDNIVYIEGRVSIKEEEGSITIIANKIQNFQLGTSLNEKSSPNEKFNKQEKNTDISRIKVLNVNITDLTEEQKNKLRGALKFFSGDRDNTQVYIINNESKLPAGGIFLNGDTLDEIKEIVGEKNVMI